MADVLKRRVKQNNDHKHPGKDEHTQKKRAETIMRLSAWSILSPQEKLRRLDERLGVGVGAKRQRAKLAAMMEGNV